jgi:dienelactone hydrolase
MPNTALTPKQIFSASDSLAYLQWGEDGCFCLRTQASANNLPRVIKVEDSGETTPISPKELAVRTRVHEYGGRPYLVSGDTLFFCRDDTQQIMQHTWRNTTGETLPGDNSRLDNKSPTIALTPDLSQGQLRYADFDHDLKRRQLLAIREDHRKNPVQNTLVAIPLPTASSGCSDADNLYPDDPASFSPHEGQVLFDDADFIASPRLSPDGKFLAFITWSHPNMPWDNTELRVIELDHEPDSSTASADSSGFVHHKLAGIKDGAIQQLKFDAAGQLWFMSDHEGWWQLYYLPELSTLLNGTTSTFHISDARPVFTPQRDCASPPWIVGQQQFAITHDDCAVTACVHESLWQVNLGQNDKLQVIASGLSHVESIACHQGRVRMIAGTPSEPGGLLEYRHSGWQAMIELQWLPNSVSLVAIPPVHITYPTGTDHRENAYGLLYRPDQPAPPLIVTVHGGPSSSAKAGLNPMTQYWLQQGFAVLDVDHRGSTGYGRQFRKRLYGDWGKIDIEDIMAAVHYVVAQKWVNPEAVFIRGGSAGGYAVLASLCQSDLFKGGACYYGISDMTILAADTHKFESHYVEQLIGPLPAFADRYRERSPIHHIDSIQAPVLFLHGKLDKVVPPEQADLIYQALKPRIPACQLLIFADEAHGFRKTANQIKALETEIAFYQGILSALS